MIRDRLEQDLERLCEVLLAAERPRSLGPGTDPRAWLEEHDAERSWVFDQAPVAVTPTRNVVGHVQLHTPEPGRVTDVLTEGVGRPRGELLAVARLFVRSGPHALGIARFLLRESLRYAGDRGRTAVVDLHDNALLSEALCASYGFERLPSEDPEVAWTVHTGSRPAHR